MSRACPAPPPGTPLYTRRVDEIGALYGEGRRRLSAIVSGLSVAQAQQRVPACPEWTVQDVVAHLAGGCTDVLVGNVDGITTEAWADAQVRDRRDRPIEQLLQEWSVAALELEGGAAQRLPGLLRELWILDLTSHEHDVRGAIDRAGDRDAPAILRVTDLLVEEGLHRQVVALALGGLAVRTPTVSWFVGGATPPTATLAPAFAGDDGSSPGSEGDRRVPGVACSLFDLFRALTGRRSRSQIAGFDWTVDPAPYVAAFEFGTFTTRTSDLDE